MWSNQVKISIARKLILASLFLVYFSSANADLTDGLVAYWSFDDCTAKDNSGNGHDGTINGNPQCVNGTKDNAFQFDGVNDYIYVPNSGGLNITQQVSYGGWVKLKDITTLSDNNGILIKDGSPEDKAYRLAIHDNTGSLTCNPDFTPVYNFVFSLSAKYEGGPCGWGDGGQSIQKDTWAFLFIVYGNNQINAYFNGQLAKTYPAAEMEPLPFPLFNGSNNPIPLWIGARGNNFGFFNGLIDELRIYNRAITPSEVTALYQQGATNTAETVTISGQINVGAKAAQDVRLSVSGDGLAKFCSVDTSGKFNCQIPKGWTGYLIPESTSITFTPKTLHVSDIQKDIDAVEINGEMVVEVLKVEPTDALKSKFTVFTVTGTNLTEGSIKFDLAGCKPSNLEFEPENATTTQRRFRCMPTATGGKIGRILSTADDKLLKMFRVQVAAKPPKVTDISPKNVLFGEDTLFTVTGTDLVADLVYSLNECDKMQEVGAGTATKRYFQCTPKNSEGKQFGKVSLKDGTLIKDFSVNVSSSVKVKSVAAKLSYFSKPSLFSCLGGTLCGNFPLGDFIDTATFSSDTHWYIKANGKKIYSGTLGDTFKGVFHFNSGETHIDLKANEGTISFSWDKQKKLINFNLTGGLQLLKPELAGKPTIEIGFATFKAAFTIDLLKQPKNAVVKAAAWSYDGRNVDSVNFLTQETIALRQARIEQYVYPDIKRKIQWLNDVNSRTMAKNKLAKEVAENLDEALSTIKLIPYVGFKPVDKDAGLELIKLFTNYSFSVNDNAGFTEALIKNFSSSFSENIIDFKNGDYLGVAANLSFSTYETMIDALSAFKLNENLEAIHAHEIAKEVINQYFANGGSIYSLASQVLPNAKPSEKTWENVIRAIASNLDCRVNARCTLDLFSEDYEPELVNRLVQNYLATLRVLAGYGEFYLHNSP